MGHDSIFQLQKPIPKNESHNVDNDSDGRGIRLQNEDYKKYGFRMAGLAQGSLQAFIPSLQSVGLALKKEQEKDESLQQSLKTDLLNQKANKENEKEQEEHKLVTLKDKHESLKDDLKEKKEELSEIKNQTYQRNRSAWTSLLITGIILLPFTIYFFIFYSSVGYSAFFKEFTLESLAQSGDFKLAEAIFDSNALSNSYHDGIMSLLFILLMPIIFLALGFVLNKWEKEKGKLKYIKIPAIIIFAFIFDALLSYEICEKIYNLHTQMSLEELPEYSLGLAFKDPRFWTIIFLGFVSYLIWGIVFGYFMNALEQLDLNKVLKEKVEKEIERIKEDINDNSTKQTETTNLISALKAQIQKLDNQINGTVARYDINRIKLELNNFHSGWQQYLAGMGKSHAEKNEITIAFNETIETITTI